MFPALINATLETLYMVFGAGLLALLLGGPIGIILYVTAPQRFWANQSLHQSLGIVVNITRSIPFIILMIALIPFTRWIVGTAIGTTAAIVPLAIGAAPFLARIVESALNEISSGLVETGQAMGATPMQIIYKILLPEALPNLIRGLTTTLIALVGYSAMAGAVGGGGLGSLAYHYGYQRFDTMVMVSTIIILILLVQIIQWVGEHVARRVTRS